MKIEKHRIPNVTEEEGCNFCGCPLLVGDMATYAEGGVFCSSACALRQRGGNDMEERYADLAADLS